GPPLVDYQASASLVPDLPVSSITAPASARSWISRCSVVRLAPSCRAKLALAQVYDAAVGRHRVEKPDSRWCLVASFDTRQKDAGRDEASVSVGAGRELVYAPGFFMAPPAQHRFTRRTSGRR